MDPYQTRMTLVSMDLGAQSVPKRYFLELLVPHNTALALVLEVMVTLSTLITEDLSQKVSFVSLTTPIVNSDTM